VPPGRRLLARWPNCRDDYVWVASSDVETLPTDQELSMATITASMFMALDGVVDPGVGHWHFPYYNDEMGKAVEGTHDADLMLFGRVTFESFAGAWPNREAAGAEDAEFAKRLGDTRKIVVSREPLVFTWRNSEQLQGDLVEGVAALKADASVRRIALSGSVSIVRQLLRAGLLDELHLFVHPVLAGSGLRLFEDGTAEVPLRLLSSQAFATGVLYLVYGPDPNPPTGGYEQARENLPRE
jgi:dihydrofolate reductase